MIQNKNWQIFMSDKSYKMIGGHPTGIVAISACSYDIFSQGEQ